MLINLFYTMETTKFRAKIEGADSWIFGLPYSVNSDNKVDSIKTIETKHVERIKTDTLGMFTGGYDENETEIYHGDICKSGNLVFAVKWNKEAMAFMAHTGIESVPFNWFSGIGSEKCVKIGDIYDNPELLKDIA
jgi:hypothetical protein